MLYAIYPLCLPLRYVCDKIISDVYAVIFVPQFSLLLLFFFGQFHNAFLRIFCVMFSGVDFVLFFAFFTPNSRVLLCWSVGLK